jgi:hypothetical protein
VRGIVATAVFGLFFGLLLLFSPSPTVLSSTLDVYEGPRYERAPGFHFEKPSLFSVSEDGSVLFVASEDDRRVATFDAVSGKGG